MNMESILTGFHTFLIHFWKNYNYFLKNTHQVCNLITSQCSVECQYKMVDKVAPILILLRFLKLYYKGFNSKEIIFVIYELYMGFNMMFI